MAAKPSSADRAALAGLVAQAGGGMIAPGSLATLGGKNKIGGGQHGGRNTTLALSDVAGNGRSRPTTPAGGKPGAAKPGRARSATPTSSAPTFQGGGTGLHSAFYNEKVKYLGAKTCDGKPTEENLQAAVKEMRMGKKKAVSMSLHLDPDYIKLVDPKTRDVIKTTHLSEVLCWNAYPKDKNSKFVVYMAASGDGRVELRQCHVIVCKGSELTAGLKMAISNLTSNADFGTMMVSGQEVPKPPPRLDQVNESEYQQVYVNTTWKFQCDVVYHGTAKTKEDNTPKSADNVVRRIALLTKARNRRLSKSGVDDTTCTPMNEMEITLAATDRSLRMVDRLTGLKIDQVLLADICFVHAVDGKDPYVAIMVKKASSPIKTMYIFRVAYRDGQAITKELLSMSKQSIAETTTEALQEASPFTPAPGAAREPVTGPLHAMQLHRSDLTPDKILGSGQFGEVYLAYHTVKSKKKGTKIIKRAVKMLKGVADAAAKDEFVHECNMMVEAGEHTNLVKMVGVSLQQAPWLCVLEFLPNGDLQGLLQDLAADGITLELGVQLDMCRQLTEGGAHLASRRLVHMDLAARNVLVGKNNVMKIADLGLTHLCCDEGPYYVLPARIPLALKWLSPEAMESLFFSEYSDVWAMAVTFWEIFMYGAMPFRSVLNANIFNGLKGGLRLKQPPSVPAAVWKVISTCWFDEMPKRPKFSALRDAIVPFLEKYPAVDATQRDIGAMRGLM